MERPFNNQFPQLIKLLGRGAFGEVYLADWNDKKVAVKKFLKPESKEIEKEIKALEKLEHTNIIRFFWDYWQDDNIFLVMEYAENGSLNEWIKKNQNDPHNWNLNKKLMLQITEGLDYIHSKELVHRDLKSDNILLDSNNNAKLADFGLSKARENLSLLQTNTNGNPMGTSRWMAPENIKGKFSKYSDIYSLGMVFWEIVSKNTIPFQNFKMNEQIFWNVGNSNLKEGIPTNTPEKIKKIIKFCWKSEPNTRIKLQLLKEILNKSEESIIDWKGLKDGLLEKTLINNNVRNILIIGLTGSGKSALSNTLYGEEIFKSSDSSISETKNFQQSEVFEWKKANLTYRFTVIDNIGFGDTQGEEFLEQILYRIGEGIVKIQEQGINQIFFLIKDRFNPTVIKAFETFKEFINESEVNKFTTLIRTNFVNFNNDEECEKDKNILLERNLRIRELINSCNGFLHINNPPLEKKRRKIEVDNEDDFLSDQQESREIILNHLIENCPNNYQLNWSNSEEVKEKVADCIIRLEDTEMTEEQINNKKQEIIEKINERINNVKKEFTNLIEANTLK